MTTEKLPPFFQLRAQLLLNRVPVDLAGPLCARQGRDLRRQGVSLRFPIANGLDERLQVSTNRQRTTWNRTKKRNAWGQAKRETRKSTDWFTISAPELRIVSEDLWTRVHERMEQTKAIYLRGTKGQLWGRPASRASTCCPGWLAVERAAAACM